MSYGFVALLYFAPAHFDRISTAWDFVVPFVSSLLLSALAWSQKLAIAGVYSALVVSNCPCFLGCRRISVHCRAKNGCGEFTVGS